MRKSNILLLLLILSFRQSSGQTWINTLLDDRVSVDFPSPPEVQEVGNKKIYQVVELEYIVNVVTADMNQNPNFGVKPEELNNFYNGVIKGRLDASTDSKLLTEQKIYLGKYEGREIQYTKDFNEKNDILVASRIILVDKTFYTFDIWKLSDKGLTKLTKKFFKSVSVK